MSKSLRAIVERHHVVWRDHRARAVIHDHQDTPPAAKKSGEVKDEKPTDPNQARLPEIKKLEKEGRSGTGSGN